MPGSGTRRNVYSEGDGGKFDNLLNEASCMDSMFPTAGTQLDLDEPNYIIDDEEQKEFDDDDDSMSKCDSDLSSKLSIDILDDDCLRYSSPTPSVSISSSVNSSSITFPSVNVPLSDYQKIQIMKQTTDTWGNYQIDKYGRIIIVDENGHRVDPTKGSMETAELRAQAKVREKELSREQKWVDMLEDWENVISKKEMLIKRRIRKGIPGSMRGSVWPKLINLHDAKKEKPSRYYFDLLQKEINLKNDQQIRKDLPRLMQDHVMFKSPEAGSRTIMCSGQGLLYNVLKAYSIHDPSVGYVQGMDSVAAPALLYFPEETAFWYLERLLNSPKFNLRYLYVDKMPLAHTYLAVNRRLVQRYLPNLARVFEELCIDDGYSYAFRWYTMRFAQFSPDLSYRIMDIYLYEGDKVLYRVAMALLAMNEKNLLKIAKNNPEELLHALTNIEHQHHEHSGDHADEIIQAACNIKITKDEIAKLTQEVKESME